MGYDLNFFSARIYAGTGTTPLFKLPAGASAITVLDGYIVAAGTAAAGYQLVTWPGTLAGSAAVVSTGTVGTFGTGAGTIVFPLAIGAAGTLVIGGDGRVEANTWVGLQASGDAGTCAGHAGTATNVVIAYVNGIHTT
jgi:hypothetical protein